MFIYFLAIVRRLTALDERELVRKISSRDPKALEELYDRYSRLVYSLVYSIVKIQEDAEDVLQEIFLQAWEKASTFDSAKGSVYTWLMTLTRNRAIDRIRSKSYRSRDRSDMEIEIEMLPNTTESTPLDAVVAGERTREVKQALDQLPNEQREIIMFAYFGGYTQSEISQQLNVPLGTVKTRMRLGMKKLQTILVGQR